MRSSEILLASTLHDPRGVFSDLVEPASKIVLQGYKGWVINVTPTTNIKVKETLRDLSSQGIYLTETDRSHPIVPDNIENDHLYLLTRVQAIAQESGIARIQYTDGDRIITAARHFPEALMIMSQRASELTGNTNSYLNFRRSPEDYFTHPQPLVETEFEFNRLYSQAFGMPIDIGSTSHVMSTDVLAEVLEKSPELEPVSFPHPKWLIIAKGMGANIRSEETSKVLTFETPDQFRTGVAEDYYEQLRNYMATVGRESTLSPKEWDLRFRTEKQYLTLLRNHLAVFSLDEKEQNSLSDEITRSLSNLERKREAILETLNRTDQEIRSDIMKRAEHALTQGEKS